jgi:hypothetical protein
VRRAARLGLLDEVVHPTVLDTAARAWASRSKRSLENYFSANQELRFFDLFKTCVSGRPGL